MSSTASSAQQTSWSEERINRFLEDENPCHQRIELPYGLSTSGKDLSQIPKLIFPDDMTGKTVLDVGSFLGYYSLEAWKRGASKVVGVDISRDHVRQARTIAEILGAPIEYHRMDIEREQPEESFDYVIYFNVLHHNLQPMAVLDRLIGLTRERLIMQIAGLGETNAQRRIRKLGANFFVRRQIKELPLIFVGKGGVQEKSEEQFYFSMSALQVLLMHQRHAFARLEKFPAPFRDREILIGHRRRVGHLLLVAGPTGVDLGGLIDGIKAGRFQDLCSNFGVSDPDAWDLLSPELHTKNKQIKIDKLIYKYDFLRPWRRNGGTHDRDEALEIFNCAQTYEVIVAVASRETMIRRIEQQIAESESQKSSRAKRLRNVQELYQRPQRVAEVLEDWLDFCRRKQAKLTFVDVTSEPRIIDSDECKKLLA